MPKIAKMVLVPWGAQSRVIALRGALIIGFFWLIFGFATTSTITTILAEKEWLGHPILPFVIFCTVAFVLGIVLHQAFGRSIAPLAIGLGLFSLIAFGPTAILAAAAILWVAYIFGEFIVRATPESDADQLNFLLRIILGLVVFGLILNVAIALPVNYTRIYALAFLLILFVGRNTHQKLAKELKALARISRAPLDFWGGIAVIAMSVLVCIQIAYAAFPERYYDSLALHLLIADVVRHSGQWHFAADFLSVAAQPITADWLYAVIYVLGGEAGAKLLNYLFFLLAAALCFSICFRRYGRKPAMAATLVLLTSPFVFIEAASCFIDNFLTMVVTVTVAVVAVWPRLSSRDRVLASSVLLGGLPAAKLQGSFVSLTFSFLLIFKRIWRDIRSVQHHVIYVILVLFLLAAVPLLIAFAITGNPVMPFFNAIFRSPYFPASNFKGLYPPDLSFTALHSLTFHTSKHFQGFDGAFGFQFVSFGLVALVATFVRRTFFSVATLAIIVIYGAAILFLTADARYFYPIFPAFSILIALSLFMLSESSGMIFVRAGVAGAIVISLINFLYFPSAGWILPSFYPSALADRSVRQTMIANAKPQRLLDEYVNRNYGKRARVVYLDEPVGYPLVGTPIYTNWYMPKVAAGLAAAKSKGAVGHWLASLGATHVIISTQKLGIPNEKIVRKYLATEARPEMVVSHEALYRIPAKVRFPTVLSAPGSWAHWSFNGASRISSAFRLSPGHYVWFATPRLTAQQRELRISIKASCKGLRGQISIQVNWQFLGKSRRRVETKSVPCAGAIGGKFGATFERPPSSVSAVIYVLKSDEGGALVSDPAVFTTDITIPEPLPLYRRDWSRSPVWLGLKRRLTKFFR